MKPIAQLIAQWLRSFGDGLKDGGTHDNTSFFCVDGLSRLVFSQVFGEHGRCKRQCCAKVRALGPNIYEERHACPHTTRIACWRPRLCLLPTRLK